MRNATLYPYFLKKSQWGWGGKKEGGGGGGDYSREMLVWSNGLGSRYLLGGGC